MPWVSMRSSYHCGSAHSATDSVQQMQCLADSGVLFEPNAACSGNVDVACPIGV